MTKDARIGLLLTVIPLTVVLAYLFVTHGATSFEPDSVGYIDFYPHRTFGYPAVLALIHLLAGSYAPVSYVQAAILSASISAAAFSAYRLFGNWMAAALLAAAMAGNPAFLSVISQIMTECLSAACFNVLCAAVLTHARRPHAAPAATYALLVFVSMALRPANAVIVPCILLAYAVFEPGAMRQRVRHAWKPVASVLAAAILALLMTPVLLHMVHPQSRPTSPLPKGLLQKVIFHDDAPQSAAGVSQNDSHFIAAAAAPARQYIQAAPADLRWYFTAQYSDRLRFDVILPYLQREHRSGPYQAGDIDRILFDYSIAFIRQHPADYLADVMTEYRNLISYRVTAYPAMSARVVAYFRTHPPVWITLDPQAPAGLRVSSVPPAGMITVSLGGTVGNQPSLFHIGRSIPFAAVLALRTAYLGAALLGLAAIVATLLGLRAPAPLRNAIGALAIAGLLLHAIALATVISEFGLHRYMDPLWGPVCVIWALAIQTAIGWRYPAAASRQDAGSADGRLGFHTARF